MRGDCMRSGYIKLDKIITDDIRCDQMTSDEIGLDEMR